MANNTQPPGLLERRKVEGEVTVSEVLANPAPLGLMGFGMTTVLLNIHNAGIYPLDSMILAMGIFYGGIAQIIAGLLEYRKGNTFGTTAFTSYGLFWLTLVALILLPDFGWKDAIAKNKTSFGFYLFMWGLFTGYMFIGTLKLNRALQVVFASLTILFWLLACENWFGLPQVICGIEGIFCGFSAIYAAAAQVLNECYGKTVLPLGFVKK
jgi:hypothetical protein